MRSRAALLIALCTGHAGTARAQCVTDHEELDCCSGFESMPSYDLPNPDTGNYDRCLERPERTGCYGFDVSDPYAWLLSLFAPERANVACPQGVVGVLYGGEDLNGPNKTLFLHPIGTDQVKEIHACGGEGALDPRACNGDVELLVHQDGGPPVYVPAEPLRFDEVPDSGTGDASTSRDRSSNATVGEAPEAGCSVRAARSRRSGIELAVLVALGALAVTRRRRARRG